MDLVRIGPMRMTVRAEREVLTEVGLCAGKMFVGTVDAVVVVVRC